MIPLGNRVELGGVVLGVVVEQIPNGVIVRDIDGTRYRVRAPRPPKLIYLIERLDA